jgi:hypothetical protein
MVIQIYSFVNKYKIINKNKLFYQLFKAINKDFHETVALLIKNPKCNINEKNDDSGLTALQWGDYIKFLCKEIVHAI